MKKIAWIVVFLVFTGISNAQQKTEMQEAPAQQLERKVNNLDRMVIELGLSEAQKASILAISEKYGEQKVAIRSTATREQLNQLSEEERLEMRAVLTKGQLDKYDNLVEKRKQAQMAAESKLSQ